MILFPFLASVLLIAAIACLLGLTPQRIADDLLKLTTAKPTMKNKVLVAKKKKKGNRIADHFNRIQTSLTAMGKGGRFALVCALSLVLLIAGGMIAALLGNLFLVPVLAAALAGIPFLYVRSTLAAYQKQVDEELETALSVVTSAYMRSEDLLTAVRESVPNLKPPIRGVFERFLSRTTAVSADIRAAIRDMREQIDNEIYRDWCDCLLQCQEDKSMSKALPPIVGKLSDIRVTNNELRTLTEQPKKEYWTMAGLLAANVPLLYVINRDWCASLVDTTPGKLTLAITVLVVLVTAVFLQRFTKPIQIRR